ncbi:MAG TPA: hypothetical protein VK733_09145 [Gemmatimonadaceae bacterium]|jgi:hypothetical protein|nr:hypothetical protein [Gemmatimonadaceae bacterium]
MIIATIISIVLTGLVFFVTRSPFEKLGVLGDLLTGLLVTLVFTASTIVIWLLLAPIELWVDRRGPIFFFAIPFVCGALGAHAWRRIYRAPS